jgi:glycosyltransferase involved in cell wall biosynthesis
MKVIHLIPHGLSHGQFHGAERVVYSLAKGLLDEGVEVVVVTAPGIAPQFRRLTGLRLYVLPISSGGLVHRVNSYIRGIHQLREIVDEEAPQILHVHGDLARTMALAIRPKCVVVETLHGRDLREPCLPRINEQVSDLAASVLFDGNVFYVSSCIKQYSFLRLSKPSVVIHNSLDPEILAYLSAPSEPQTGGRYVLWLGRLNYTKGPDILIKALSLRKKDDIRVVFLGDGPLRSSLEVLAKRLNMQADFLGFVDEPTKAALLRNASAIVASIRHAGLSQVLTEAAASGAPVIAAFDDEASEELGTRVTFVKELGPVELSKALDKVLSVGTRRNAVCNVLPNSTFARKYLSFYHLLLGEAIR